jgi:hypothetical protein
MRSTLILVAASTLALQGCASASKALGLTSTAPNEFNILTKAPLVVPPEYNLRPPEIGASSAENNYSQASARKALLGDIDATEPSRGEIVLMAKAGVGRSDQEIRLEIDGLNSVERKSEGYTDRVLGWEGGQFLPRNGDALDPETEARRLKAVQSATGGAPATISRRPGGPKLPGL